MYKPDTFYKTEHLNIDEKKELLSWSKDKSFKWWVDKLDVSESWARQKIDMSYNEVITKLDDSCHFVVIHRKGYNEHYYLEVAFCTLAKKPEYYLWINCEEKYVKEIVQKFKLNIL
jgi:hypothetical protein